MNIKDIKFKISILMQMVRTTSCEEDKARYLKEIEVLLQEIDEVSVRCKGIIDGSVFDEKVVEEIKEYLENKNRVCAIEIWQEALNEEGRPQKWQSAEIGDIVSQIPGWKKLDKTARFGKYGPQKGFQKIQKK